MRMQASTNIRPAPLSPNHFSNSLLSIPTALVWLLRCFGRLPAFDFLRRFSSPLFSQSSFSAFLCGPSYTGRSPPEIVVVSGALRNSSVAPYLPVMHLACSYSGPPPYPTPAPNYGPFIKIWWKFTVSSHTTHHLPAHPCVWTQVKNLCGHTKLLVTYFFNFFYF